MAEKITNGFFNKELNESMNEASNVDIQMNKKLDYAGEYRMIVETKKYKTKDGDVYEFPNLAVAEKSGSLLLNFTLSCADDDADNVDIGDYLYGMIVIAPAPDAPVKKQNTIIRMNKPRIAALVGEKLMEDFSYGEEWVVKNLTSEFSDESDSDGEYEIIRDHNMKQEVIVTVVVDEYNGDFKPSIKTIRPMEEGFVSFSKGEAIVGDSNGSAFSDDKESSSDDSSSEDEYETEQSDSTAEVSEF